MKNDNDLIYSNQFKKYLQELKKYYLEIKFVATNVHMDEIITFLIIVLLCQLD